jgi:hypothetical protein
MVLSGSGGERNGDSILALNSNCKSLPWTPGQKKLKTSKHLTSNLLIPHYKRAVGKPHRSSGRRPSSSVPRSHEVPGTSTPKRPFRRVACVGISQVQETVFDDETTSGISWARSYRTLRDGSLEGSLSQALRARLRSGCPSRDRHQALASTPGQGRKRAPDCMGAQRSRTKDDDC